MSDKKAPGDHILPALFGAPAMGWRHIQGMEPEGHLGHDTHFDTSVISCMTGMDSYILASNSQNVVQPYFNVKEALHYHYGFTDEQNQIMRELARNYLVKSYDCLRRICCGCFAA